MNIICIEDIIISRTRHTYYYSATMPLTGNQNDPGLEIEPTSIDRWELQSYYITGDERGRKK